MRSALGLAASMGLNGLIETENVDIFIERITDCGVFRISSMTSLVTYFCPLAIVVIQCLEAEGRCEVGWFLFKRINRGNDEQLRVLSSGCLSSVLIQHLVESNSLSPIIPSRHLRQKHKSLIDFQFSFLLEGQTNRGALRREPSSRPNEVDSESTSSRLSR